MKALMITAMSSGAGKTVMSCALMAALKKRGLRVQAFKSGPDYIDPMFHTRVLGVESRNLDLFLQGEEGVRKSFATAEGDFAIVEGAMGFYDGIGGGTVASAWDLTCCLNLPAILTLRPQGNGVTLAAQIRGLQAFRSESHIAGLLLSDCSEQRAKTLSTILERECGLPVLGALPHMSEAELKSRHLGLLTAAEIADFQERIERLAKQIEETADLDRLLAITAEINLPGEKSVQTARPVNCRIAVARDEAFCFLYSDNLKALQRAGAELVFFSPLRDLHLPEADGLYLCGGYPELYAEQLADNTKMRADIREWLQNGKPTVAECGAFLYLQQSLEDTVGKVWKMCGALPGQGYRTEHLQRFGYVTLVAEDDSLLFRRGDRIPAHEFHYWDSTENGNALCAQKMDGKNRRCGFATETLYAAFPHLHFGGTLPMAERFAAACVRGREQ